MAYEFKLPDLGEGLTEGEIARWLVEEGAVVPVGTVLVVIGGDGTVAEAAPAPASAGPVQPRNNELRAATEKVRATPLIRKVAAELGVDLASVTGSGPQGRITEEDVRAAAGGAVAATATEGSRVSLRGVKRQMFEHLTRAHEIPAVTWVEECDFAGVDLKRLVPLVLQAVVESLKEFPELNARVENGELVLLDRYDLGIAVQTDQGLVVPVVHGADKLSLDDLDAEVRRLAEAAQTATLKPEELRGGTFTITSAGKAAGLFVTPLINHPEVAILGIHRIDQRAVVRGGEVVARAMGNVSVTFDHRVIDGKRAADFGLAVIGRLQQS